MSRGRWHARSVKNPPHRCRCPGVLIQCVEYTGRKYLILLPKGGPGHATDPKGVGTMGAMLAPCWHFLRSWALLGRVVRFLLRLLLLLAGFCASWNAPGSILEGFGWVLEPPGACFSRFLRAYVLALSERSECDKTTVLLDRNTCRKQRAQREKSQKIALGAFRTKLSVTVVPKTRLGPHQARFWRR